MKSTLFLTPLLLASVACSAVAAPGGRGGPDGDGTITRAELTTKIDARFARLDGNNDGRITTTEMEAAKANRAERRAERAAKNPERAGKRGGRRGPRGDRPDLDVNGDGVITRGEFAAPMLERFSRADANNDGEVTRDERKAAREARRAARD